MCLKNTCTAVKDLFSACRIAQPKEMNDEKKNSEQKENGTRYGKKEVKNNNYSKKLIMNAICVLICQKTKWQNLKPVQNKSKEKEKKTPTSDRH